MIYVDEIGNELNHFGDLLEQGQTINVTKMRPPPNLEVAEITNAKPDLVVLDYELTKVEQGQRPATYMGGTLATRIRESVSDVPIVLLTRKELLRKYTGAVAQLGAIDYRLFKDEVDTDPGHAQEVVLALIEGYTSLREAASREWDSLTRILGADSHETETLREAVPPLEPAPDESGRLEWTIPRAARWIIRTLMEFPGILYDSDFAAASLGIDSDSFARKKVQAFASPARYLGPFSRLKPLWWRSRLHRLAYAVLKDAGAEPPLSDNFATAFRKARGGRLSPSICVYSGQPHADTICYVLRAPVKRSYSLEYFPDNRPSVMEPARVSFKAIVEDIRVDEALFSSDGRALLEAIRKGVNPGTPQDMHKT